jgi:hypothetical protein
LHRNRRTLMDTDPLAKPADPGAYVGHEPERQAETIPGGVRPEHERIAAHSTQHEEDPEAADASLAADEGGHRAQRGGDSQGQS